MMYTAHFRFWPDIGPGVGAVRPSPVFDLATSVDGELAEEAAAAALADAAFRAFGPARPWRPIRRVETGRAFPHLRGGIGIQLLRARDGWVALAAPDRATWLTVSMTFLRRRLYHRYDEFTAWQSAEVNELATLVLATHHAEDVIGTCDTYGIPAFLIQGWQDADTHGRSMPAALAEALHYGALLPGRS